MAENSSTENQDFENSSLQENSELYAFIEAIIKKWYHIMDYKWLMRKITHTRFQGEYIKKIDAKAVFDKLVILPD